MNALLAYYLTVSWLASLEFSMTSWWHDTGAKSGKENVIFDFWLVTMSWSNYQSEKKRHPTHNVSLLFAPGAGLLSHSLLSDWPRPVTLEISRNLKIGSRYGKENQLPFLDLASVSPWLFSDISQVRITSSGPMGCLPANVILDPWIPHDFSTSSLGPISGL